MIALEINRMAFAFALTDCHSYRSSQDVVGKGKKGCEARRLGALYRTYALTIYKKRQLLPFPVLWEM
jgi:hypothetical protein